jgi:hypothetical protein
MPVKILLTPPSDPRTGSINKAEMDEALTEFFDEVEVTSLNNSRPVVKTISCQFSKKEILDMFSSPDIVALRIYFGVHPEGQESCEGDDLSNRINTMIFAVDNGNNIFNQPGDFILIPGYNVHGGTTAIPECCGGMGGSRPPSGLNRI